MKIFYITVLLLLCIILTGTDELFAQDSTKSEPVQNQNQLQQTNIEHGSSFIDEDGDGYNDNAPDHDGDGIPNGLDPDYQKLKKKQKGKRNRFVDLDGDGINDNLQEEEKQTEQGKEQIHQQEKGTSLDQKDQQGSGKGKRKGRQ